jgi:ribonuclease-3
MSGLGHTFSDPRLLEVALTHASHAHEQHGTAQDNERLEFLGDAVLQLCVTSWLVERFPEAREGQLSALRQRLVNTDTLAAVAGRLGLGERLKLGIGEEGTGGRTRPRVLAGAVEAVLGAVFVDAGMAAAEALVRQWLREAVEEQATREGRGWKNPRSSLQEWSQRVLGETPAYEVVTEQGPPHQPTFEVVVRVGDLELGRGRGSSKRDASKLAAENALLHVAMLDPGSPESSPETPSESPSGVAP